ARGEPGRAADAGDRAPAGRAASGVGLRLRLAAGDTANASGPVVRRQSARGGQVPAADAGDRAPAGRAASACA
ncbi:hypothetical protein, partial [Nocardioides sp. P5_C9_2]